MTVELPLYQQIADYIRTKIETKEWPVGFQIPKERELCELFDASRMTVSKALNILVQMNIIYRTAGRGTFVRMSVPESKIKTLFSFSEKMQKMGKKTHSKILEYSVLTASAFPNIQHVLLLDDTDYMHRIVRQRFVEDELCAVQIIFISAKAIPTLDIRYIESSIYEYIELVLNLNIIKNEAKLQAVFTNEFLNQSFGRVIETPLLKSTSIGYLSGYIPFEINETYHLSDKFDYETTNYR